MTSTARGSDPTAVMNSGNDSHAQRIPSESADPGMSSTPSLRATSRSRSASRTGAKPTPQLPMTQVVTPCIAEGESVSSQVTWPS